MLNLNVDLGKVKQNQIIMYVWKQIEKLLRSGCKIRMSRIDVDNFEWVRVLVLSACVDQMILE